VDKAGTPIGYRVAEWPFATETEIREFIGKRTATGHMIVFHSTAANHQCIGVFIQFIGKSTKSLANCCPSESMVKHI
jgi:hypothetical protein